jgi:hypothetical protein
LEEGIGDADKNKIQTHDKKHELIENDRPAGSTHHQLRDK